MRLRILAARPSLATKVCRVDPERPQLRSELAMWSALVGEPEFLENLRNRGALANELGELLARKNCKAVDAAIEEVRGVEPDLADARLNHAIRLES